MDKTAREEESRSCKREVESEEEKTVVKRICVKPLSCGVFEEFSPMDDSGSFGILVAIFAGILVVSRGVFLRCCRVSVL